MKKKIKRIIAVLLVIVAAFAVGYLVYTGGQSCG